MVAGSWHHVLYAHASQCAHKEQFALRSPSVLRIFPRATATSVPQEIGRASCREMVWTVATAVSVQAKVVTSPKHADGRWNNEIQEWFCAKCGHNSDHVSRPVR